MHPASDLCQGLCRYAGDRVPVLMKFTVQLRRRAKQIVHNYNDICKEGKGFMGESDEGTYYMKME